MLLNLTLREMMLLPLPSIPAQKKLPYRPTQAEAEYVYDLINTHVFGEILRRPVITIAGRCRNYWGMCYGEDKVQATDTFCKIKIMDKWFCPQWMITVLAHEMCHQYQWDVFSLDRAQKGKPRLMSHGPSFYRYQPNLKQYGIALSTTSSMKRWFKHQDLFKC